VERVKRSGRLASGVGVEAEDVSIRNVKCVKRSVFEQVLALVQVRVI
jgi:hypothetical protein